MQSRITDSNYSVILASLLYAWKKQLTQYLRLDSGALGAISDTQKIGATISSIPVITIFRPKI